MVMLFPLIMLSEENARRMPIAFSVIVFPEMVLFDDSELRTTPNSNARISMFVIVTLLTP